MIKLTKVSSIILFYFLFIVLWWSLLYFLGIKKSEINYYYQFGFGLIPLIGGILGVFRSSEWGILKSKVGTALFFISVGLITWGIGQMFWSIYYNIVLRVEVPYPSLADAGYILSWPLWAVGIINLSIATGAKFSLRSIRGKLLLFIIPLILVLISLYLLVHVARQDVVTDVTGGFLKIFLDLAYPIGDVIILTLSILIYGLSFNYLGGRFKYPTIILLLGFVINYIADFSFSYATTKGTYYNGHWVDVIFPTAMTFIAIGINNFATKKD